MLVAAPPDFRKPKYKSHRGPNFNSKMFDGHVFPLGTFTMFPGWFGLWFGFDHVIDSMQ